MTTDYEEQLVSTALRGWGAAAKLTESERDQASQKMWSEFGSRREQSDLAVTAAQPTDVEVLALETQEASRWVLLERVALSAALLLTVAASLALIPTKGPQQPVDSIPIELNGVPVHFDPPHGRVLSAIGPNDLVLGPASAPEFASSGWASEDIRLVWITDLFDNRSASEFGSDIGGVTENSLESGSGRVDAYSITVSDAVAVRDGCAPRDPCVAFAESSDGPLLLRRSLITEIDVLATDEDGRVLISFTTSQSTRLRNTVLLPDLTVGER